jgi:Ca2+-binding RTX toxin-like protein
MTVYLTKTELGHEDGVKHLDPDVKNALFQALYHDHIYHPGKDDGTKASFQEDLNFSVFSPTAQILELDTSATVDTNPTLKAIIMDDGPGKGMENAGKDGSARWLTVNGGDSIFVAGGSHDTIFGGSGDDTLVGGARSELHSGSLGGGSNILWGQGGHDTLYGGDGADSLYGSGGHDSLVGGAGSGQLVNGQVLHGQLLQAGGGHDTLVAGTGSFELLRGSGGNDSISDPNKNSPPTHDTLIGSGGNDTITGQQGDTLLDTKGSHNQFWLYGSSDTLAGSMLQGGKGHDTFHIETNIGNDTITGGGGHDVVYFDKQSYTDLSLPITKDPGGGYTLSFTNGQQIQVSGIKELHFSDNHTVTLK